MFTKRDYDKISFKGVGLGMIIFGTLIFGISIADWYLVTLGENGLIAYPFFKAISGVIVIGMGYLILEIELLRKK